MNDERNDTKDGRTVMGQNGKKGKKEEGRKEKARKG